MPRSPHLDPLQVINLLSYLLTIDQDWFYYLHYNQHCHLIQASYYHLVSLLQFPHQIHPRKCQVVPLSYLSSFMMMYQFLHGSPVFLHFCAHQGSCLPFLDERKGFGECQPFFPLLVDSRMLGVELVLLYQFRIRIRVLVHGDHLK